MAKRRIRRSGSEVTVTTTIEVEVEVTCNVEPDEPETPRTFDCGGVPASQGEVEILSIASVEGSNLSGVIDELTKAEIEEIEDLAREAAAEAAMDAMEAAAEAREENRRERLWDEG